MARPPSVCVGVCQMSMSASAPANLAKAEALVRRAAAQGAGVVLLPELFETRYFPKSQASENLMMAKEVQDSPVLERFQRLSEELGIVLPVSFYEKAGQARFNSLAVYEKGRLLGVYRKSHIPDGPGYSEKFHFAPGNTGAMVFATCFGNLGCGICWDQWFPEHARVLALSGADFIVYPTAIGTEPPPAPPVDSRAHWRIVMQGHAGANLVPVFAANRVGVEPLPDGGSMTFYGSSFAAGVDGQVLASLDHEEEGVFVCALDLPSHDLQRASWGVFRDRRPDLYASLLTLDGKR